LPTALLSNHTQYSKYSFLDLTHEMSLFIDHWRELQVKFDAIYSGFLGSEEQVDIVYQFITDFSQEGQLVVVDPVMGDNGKLYASYQNNMVSAMRKLVQKANVITPNMTEMFFLLDQSYKETICEVELKKNLLALSAMGPQMVVITSVPIPDRPERTSVVAYNRVGNRFWKVSCPYLPAHYPGTGDAFTSVLTGSLMQGDSLPIALDRAVQFVSMGIRATFGYEYDNRDGMLIEKVLPNLHLPVQISSYEWL
ncbi:MAG: pyridoxamine kinase, partial [Bacteroidales bacterium]